MCGSRRAARIQIVGLIVLHAAQVWAQSTHIPLPRLRGRWDFTAYVFDVGLGTPSVVLGLAHSFYRSGEAGCGSEVKDVSAQNTGIRLSCLMFALYCIFSGNTLNVERVDVCRKVC